MEGIGGLILLGLFIGFLVIMRVFGAWMLRINEVIKELRQIKMLLQIIEGRTDKRSNTDHEAS